MKIPAHEDEIPKWLEVCDSMLGDPENHLVKRLVLMAQALTGLGAGDLSRAEYCEEKAALLFDAAAAGDVNPVGVGEGMPLMTMSRATCIACRRQGRAL